jgi:RNA polymerase sigma-70 factor (ECF subfamily)
MTNGDSQAVRASRDAAAFAGLYDQYYPRLFSYLRYRLDDDAEAEEVTAQVFERLLLRLGHYDPERGAFEPWLFAMARNALIDHTRRMKLRRFLPLEWLGEHPVTGPSPEEQLVEDEVLQQVKAALRALDARERDLLGLKFGGGLNHRQIAAITGLTDSHVGVLLFRAVNKLRAACAQECQPVVAKQLEVKHERA